MTDATPHPAISVAADIERSAAAIAAAAPGFAPRFGVVLGSGLGRFAEQVRALATIDYTALPGFPPTRVGGHAGRLVLGHIGPTPVAVLHGRAHYYEHGRADAMKVPIRVLARLGCESMLLTNAAGSLHREMPAGSVMAITDHINFTGVSPLFDEPRDDRFIDMSAAYDSALRERLHQVATASGIVLHDGVYIWFAGPSFETPAEIRAAARLGADAVGMSTVPEVVLARHAGMKVAALSTITNLAAGLSPVPLTHILTLEVARQAAATGWRLVHDFLAAPDG
jgi:purine nucleotide phosphorylase